MSAAELRRALVAAAQGYLGCRESDNSHRRVIDDYNAILPLPRGYRLAYNEPWCAAFVSAALVAAGLGPYGDLDCSCPRMLAAATAAGRSASAQSGHDAAVGDLVFYDWDGDGVSDHVGIVAAVEGEALVVLEGNYADAVGRRRLSRRAGSILAFAWPDYAAAARAAGTTTATGTGGTGTGSGTGGTPASTASGTATGTSGTASPSGTATPSAAAGLAALPLLRQGERGEVVRSAQLLLIGRGCRCGPEGADGIFGPATVGAVMRFQRNAKLDVDALVGPRTWSALLGL